MVKEHSTMRILGVYLIFEIISFIIVLRELIVKILLPNPSPWKERFVVLDIVTPNDYVFVKKLIVVVTSHEAENTPPLLI